MNTLMEAIQHHEICQILLSKHTIRSCWQIFIRILYNNRDGGISINPLLHEGRVSSGTPTAEITPENWYIIDIKKIYNRKWILQRTDTPNTVSQKKVPIGPPKPQFLSET